MARHLQTLVEVNDLRAEIDTALAPLIEAIWQLGIRTEYCCEDQGWVPENAESKCNWSYVIFSSVEDFQRFLNLFADSELSGRRFLQPPSRAKREEHARLRWRHHLMVEPDSAKYRCSFNDAPLGSQHLVHFRVRMMLPTDDITAVVQHLCAHGDGNGPIPGATITL